MPLDGLVVIDFSHLVAGPFCTMMLADAGATVLKIERPGGEIARARWPTVRSDQGSCSVYFAALNRGKKSLVLDMATAEVKEVVARLLERADVVVENFRPGVFERLTGTSYGELEREYPRLILASVGLFGNYRLTPEEARRPGIAVVAEAEAGVTANARDADGSPVWSGFALGDITAGIFLYSAIVTALAQRHRDGKGQRVDISMFESMLAINAVQIARAQADSTTDDPTMGGGYGLVATSDGFVALGVNSDGFFRSLFTAIGREDIATDPAYSTEQRRSQRHQELIGIVKRWAAEHTTDDVIAALNTSAVPCGRVRTSSDIVGSQADRDRESLSVALWGDTEMRLPASPMRLRGMDRASRRRIPGLGEHTAESLAEFLNMDSSLIEKYANAGFIALGGDWK